MQLSRSDTSHPQMRAGPLRTAEQCSIGGQCSPFRSLWLRTTGVIIGLGGLMALALFFSIDYFVTERFRALHQERLARVVEQSRLAAETDLRQLQGVASLIVSDADLVNSTYYHRHLEGERDHPQAAVERIALAFDFASVSLWTPEGRLLAGTGVPLAYDSRSRETVPPNAGFRRVENGIWMIATGLLTYNDNPLAVVQIGRPIDARLTSAAEAPRGTADDTMPAAVTVLLDKHAEPPIVLSVRAADTVADAVVGIKRLLAIILSVFGVLLTIGLAVGIRRIFRPVLDVIQAALAVGRGELGRKVETTGGSRELAGLVGAFNEMSDGLLRLRELERQVQHQEQLSAIGRAAARVAHDLNNPLTVITSTADLAAMRSDLDACLAADVRLIQHHCARARATIEALLSYGRPVRLRLQSVDLSAICCDIAAAWGRRHPHVRLDLPDPAENIPAMIDTLQVERMLENVLDNARTVSHRIVMTIATEGRRAMIAIADEGPGFSAEAQAHLFEPFFTTQTGGTGLGLASSLAIARAHGGDIVVSSGPPAVVTIRLPLAAAPEAQPNA